MKIGKLVEQYLKYLKSLGRSDHTTKSAKSGLGRFLKFLDSQQLEDIDALTGELLSEYQQELAFTPTARGSLPAPRSRAQLLGVVRGFTRFLKEKDYLVNDPGKTIKLPRKPRRLPSVILSTEEIKRLFDSADKRTNRGYRNRVILELLYDTAVRRAEVADITLADLDLQAGFIHIHGKGDKDRVVPLSCRVREMLREYILMVRPSFLNGKDPGFLILNRWGKRMDANGIWAVVKRCTLLAGIEKNVTPHTLRHTCATHMLRNGAPVRHLQELLGHESLESTQIYTHVTINDLKRIHSKYHPSEKMSGIPR